MKLKKWIGLLLATALMMGLAVPVGAVADNSVTVTPWTDEHRIFAGNDSITLPEMPPEFEAEPIKNTQHDTNQSPEDAVHPDSWTLTLEKNQPVMIKEIGTAKLTVNGAFGAVLVIDDSQIGNLVVDGKGGATIITAGGTTIAHTQLETAADLKEFTDVDSADWYNEPIDIETSGGVLAGIGDDMFVPGRNISRQELTAKGFQNVNIGEMVSGLVDLDGKFASVVNESEQARLRVDGHIYSLANLADSLLMVNGDVIITTRKGDIETPASSPNTASSGSGGSGGSGGYQGDSRTGTVTFDLNDGRGVYHTTTVQYGQPITAPADPTRVGYIFTGWYNDPACSALWKFNYTVSGNITLYAGWMPESATTCTVSFDSQGGSSVASITDIVPGTTISAPSDPVRAGYIFDGWYKQIACTNLWHFSTDTVNGNITLYAGWSPEATTTYTVTYALSLGMTSQQLIRTSDTGATVTLPQIIDGGPSPCGWYKDEYATGFVGNSGESYTPASDITLYAGNTNP